jgi:putative endonuclease
MSSYSSGKLSELYAAAYLLSRGLIPIAWRYKTPVGEIDLIARRGNMLVFVEVKFRPNLADGAFALQPKQSARFRKAAGYYLSGRNIGADTTCRFDLIAVDGKGRIRHLDNILIATT